VSYLKNNDHKIYYPLLIYLYFLIVKELIIYPTRIPGSKSLNADEYMDLKTKNKLSELFNEISKYCESLINLKEKEAIEGWRNLFGEPFPAYG
jgi:hypothetical protein